MKSKTIYVKEAKIRYLKARQIKLRIQYNNIICLQEFKSSLSVTVENLSGKIHQLRIPYKFHHPKPLKFSTTATLKISATISVGDKLPDAILSYFDSSDELKTVSVSELTSNKKAILFTVPGAFIPTCSQKYLSGFVEKAGELRAKGVDTIACISVNDVFVMNAWKKDLNVGHEVLLLSDGNGNFIKAIG
ncbi:peroxiredoxin-2E-2 [Forsythia ovata]|uniref:Glutaredoxin-dependent peroxiredoxin n=1 Tax=Forsythia ovata TaxID=205694 RepID=A0ABD1TRB5_9LAMI